MTERLSDKQLMKRLAQGDQKAADKKNLCNFNSEINYKLKIPKKSGV